MRTKRTLNGMPKNEQNYVGLIPMLIKIAKNLTFRIYLETLKNEENKLVHSKFKKIQWDYRTRF